MSNNNENKKVYIRPEDALEFVYEISDKWKTIEEMKKDLRTMIRYFKDEKFDNLQDKFRVKP